MMYFVKCFSKEASFQKAETAVIRVYPWGGDSGVRARAQLVFAADKGFTLRMSRKAPEEGTGQALEWAANFFPGESAEYFYFSMTPDGELCWDIGSGAQGRGRCGRAPEPEYVSGVKNGLWRAELFLPLGLVERAYRRGDLDRGSILEGNFYSREGDALGCWSRVNAPAPDPHRPRDFGQVILA